MDLSQIFIKFVEFFSGIGGVFVATNMIKYSSKIPWISEGNTTKIRATAGLLSAISVVLFGLVDKTLSPEKVQGLFVSLVTFLSIWVGSHVVHKVSKEKESL